MHLTDIERRAQPRAPAGARAGRPRGRRLRRLAAALPFILPSLVGVTLFLLVPVVIVLVLSFFQWNFLT
jgi:hypothetical protein